MNPKRIGAASVAIIAATIVLNLALLAGAVAVVVLVLQALGVF